jgi:hypothetical protein
MTSSYLGRAEVTSRETAQCGYGIYLSGNIYQVASRPPGLAACTPNLPHQTLDTVWAKALEAAKKAEDEVGPENVGPWDDFEFGMLNGKLSALRWVLGDDWDMLDT